MLLFKVSPKADNVIIVMSACYKNAVLLVKWIKFSPIRPVVGVYLEASSLKWLLASEPREINSIVKHC